MTKKFSLLFLSGALLSGSFLSSALYAGLTDWEESDNIHAHSVVPHGNAEERTLRERLIQDLSQHTDTDADTEKELDLLTQALANSGPIANPNPAHDRALVHSNSAPNILAGPGDGDLTLEDFTALIDAGKEAAPVVGDAVNIFGGNSVAADHTETGPGNGSLDIGDLPVVKKVATVIIGVAKDVITNAGDIVDFIIPDWLFGGSDDEEVVKQESETLTTVTEEKLDA